MRHIDNRCRHKPSGRRRKDYLAVQQVREIQKRSLIILSVLGKHSTKLKVIRCGSELPHNLADIKRATAYSAAKNFQQRRLNLHPAC